MTILSSPYLNPAFHLIFFSILWRKETDRAAWQIAGRQPAKVKLMEIMQERQRRYPPHPALRSTAVNTEKGQTWKTNPARPLRIAHTYNRTSRMC